MYMPKPAAPENTFEIRTRAGANHRVPTTMNQRAARIRFSGAALIRCHAVKKQMAIDAGYSQNHAEAWRASKNPLAETVPKSEAQGRKNETMPAREPNTTAFSPTVLDSVMVARKAPFTTLPLAAATEAACFAFAATYSLSISS